MPKPQDTQSVLDIVKKEPIVFLTLTHELQNQHDIAFEALQHNGLWIRHLSQDNRKNSELALAALKNTALSYDLLDESLQTNIHFLLDAVGLIQEEPKIQRLFQIVLATHEHLRHSETLVAGTLPYYGNFFQYVKNHDFFTPLNIFNAVKQNPLCLKYVPEDININYKTYHEAVWINPDSIQFFPQELQAEMAEIKGSQYLDFLKQRMLKETLENTLPVKTERIKKQKL